jgi:hypothetical protein
MLEGIHGLQPCTETPRGPGVRQRTAWARPRPQATCVWATAHKLEEAPDTAWLERYLFGGRVGSRGGWARGGAAQAVQHTPTCDRDIAVGFPRRRSCSRAGRRCTAASAPRTACGPCTGGPLRPGAPALRSRFRTGRAPLPHAPHSPPRPTPLQLLLLVRSGQRGQGAQAVGHGAARQRPRVQRAAGAGPGAQPGPHARRGGARAGGGPAHAQRAARGGSLPGRPQHGRAAGARCDVASAAAAPGVRQQKRRTAVLCVVADCLAAGPDHVPDGPCAA